MVADNTFPVDVELVNKPIFEHQFAFLKYVQEKQDNLRTFLNVRVSVLLAGDVVVLGGVLASLTQDSSLSVQANWMKALVVASAVLVSAIATFSAYYSLRVLRPLPTSNVRAFTHFRDICSLDREAYEKTVLGMDDEQILRELCIDAHSLAVILSQRYRDLDRSLAFFVVSLATFAFYLVVIIVSII